MATRITEAQIRELLPELDADVSLTTFMDTANLLVSEDLVGRGLSDERLARIELYLAAHFAAVTTPNVQSESAGVGESLRGSTGMGLQYTEFGQQAMLLDRTGTLATLNKGEHRRTGMMCFGGRQETFPTTL